MNISYFKETKMKDAHNEVKEDNSDEMIDIRIEESLVRESLMKIDASSMKDDIYLLLIFFGIIALNFLIGCTKIQEYYKETESHPFSPTTLINYQKNDISSRNQFISFFLYLEGEETTQATEFRANFTYESKCYKGKDLLRTTRQQFTNFQFKTQENSMTTLPFNFYYDQIIDYERIFVTVRLISETESDYENATISIYYGNNFLNVIQISIKSTFSIIHIFLLILIVLQLKSEPFRYWHLEQKLTIPLVFVTIFYNDPIEIIHLLISPSYSILIFDCICKSVFLTYFEFFILSLFDSLRYKNRKIKKCFFTPKIVFILFLFVVTLSHRIYDTITSFDSSPSFERDSVELAFRIVEIIFHLFYYFWFISSVVKAAMQVDVTERYKFNVYFAICFSSLMFLSISYCLGLFDFFKNKTLNVFVPMATVNLFVILMICFHYPYEVLDGRFDVGQQQKQQNQNELAESSSKNELDEFN